MTKIQNYTVHSDFPSLSNDGNGTISVTVPKDLAAGVGAVTLAQTSVAMGSKDTSLRARITQDGSTWYVATALTFPLSVRYDGFSGNVTIYPTAYLERTNPTTIRLRIGAFNQGGATMRVNAAKTITAKVSTFKTPFN